MLTLFQGYSRDTSHEVIQIEFAKRYRYPPEQILDGGAIWLAGPLTHLMTDDSELLPETEQPGIRSG